STIGLTRKLRIPPQPLALGADHVLSTRVAPLSLRIRPDSRNSVVPPLPVIGELGGGGAVVARVRFQVSGLLEEPIKQFLPRKGFSRCTLTGITNAMPSSSAKLSSLTLMSLAVLASSRVEPRPVILFSKKNLIRAATSGGVPFSGTIPA